jgi:hypothetical protein
MSTVDLLVGYHWSSGPLILKGYVGAIQESHQITSREPGLLAIDDENGVQGTKVGLKLALEAWYAFGTTGFLQFDSSWSQPFEAYGARLRAGYRLTPSLSAGLEGAALGNANHDSGRAGAFLRWEWTAGELSLSAGAAGDMETVHGGYASVGGLLRF